MNAQFDDSYYNEEDEGFQYNGDEALINGEGRFMC